MRTDRKSLRSYKQTSETHLLSHVVCNTNTPENTCNEVASYDDTCQSSSGDVLEIRGQKDNMGGKYSSNGIVPLLNASNTNIPNTAIIGCNFTNCNVSLCSKFDNNEKATSTVDKASLDELVKGLTPEQLLILMTTL